MQIEAAIRCNGFVSARRLGKSINERDLYDVLEVSSGAAPGQIGVKSRLHSQPYPCGGSECTLLSKKCGTARAAQTTHTNKKAPSCSTSID